MYGVVTYHPIMAALLSGLHDLRYCLLQLAAPHPLQTW